MNQEQPEYFAYLLRLWRENDADRPVWRASLEDPNSGEQIGFTDLEALFAFLRAKTGLRSERQP